MNPTVVFTLLYGCDIKTLERFHIRHLKFILRIDRKGLLADTEILERCNTISIVAKIARHRLRWAGQVMWMDPIRIPKKVFTSEIKVGKRNVGRPKLRYKDTLKSTLKNCSIDISEIDLQNTCFNPLWETKERRAHWKEAVRDEA